MAHHITHTKEFSNLLVLTSLSFLVIGLAGGFALVLYVAALFTYCSLLSEPLGHPTRVQRSLVRFPAMEDFF